MESDKPKSVSLKIDGKPYTVPATKRVTRTVIENDKERHVDVDVPLTIYDAAKEVGVDIPVLCHRDQLNVDGTPIPQAGVCRVCAVEAKMGGRPDRVFVAACCREIADGMEVRTEGKADNGVDIGATRRTLIELLLADHPRPCARHQEFGDCELELYGERLGILNPALRDAKSGRFTIPPGEPRPDFTPRARTEGTDKSNPSIAVDHSACILCDRCVRACAAVENHVIGRRGKGYASAISFDNAKPMGQSSCVNCGECMVACPTGALTFTGAVAADPPERRGASLMTVEELRSDRWKLGRFFKRISPQFLKRSEGAVWVRVFKKGEIICRQGEFGSTAFYIDAGKVDVLLDVQLGHVRTKNANTGLFKKMSSLIFSRTEKPRSEERAGAVIPIDTSGGDLTYGNLVAQVGEGDLIGEAACLNFQPRAATVRAASDEVIVIEMLRNVLDMLRKTREFRAEMDARYRKWALANHLRSVPIFKNLPDAFIDQLRERVSLLSFEPGQPIVRQGDPADAFYLIRMGHVKVFESYADGQPLVLSYLSRSMYFGEIGLLSPAGVRTANCSALDHVEVVRIEKADFDQMIQQFPEIRERLQEVADSRLAENRARATQTREMSVENYINQGLYQAQSLLILDLEKCTRCDECVRACAQAHDGITRLVRDGLRYDKYLVTTSCRSCRDPLCMVGCPVGSIRRKGNMEIVIEDWCIGCARCAEQCPYGNINMHPIGHDRRDPATGAVDHPRKAAVCDLCTDMCLEEDETPACVYACPHDAAHRVDGQQFFEQYLVKSAKG